MRKVITAGLLCVVSSASNGEMLATTTENLGKPYTVINGACVYQQFENFSMKGDPLINAVKKAFEQMEALSKQAGADALVGYDVDFSNRTMDGEEGRVLLCGTLVKLNR